MLSTFTRTFRVRYDECDAYGHVNNTCYVRYLTETALEAVAQAGYDHARCAGMGYAWQPRVMDIEYLRPLRYGEAAQVVTWAAGLAGATLCRSFEFRVAGTDELAARARTEVELLSSATGEPAPIPVEMAGALGVTDVPAAGGQAPFPVAPPPPPGTFRQRRRVLWQDLDMTRQVSEARYMAYIDDASFGVIEAHGWPARRMVAAGFAIFLRRHQVEYLVPAQLDDELETATWASNMKRSMGTRHYTVTRLADGITLVRVHTLGVWVDLRTGHPIRIPPDFLADFAPNLVY